MPLQLPVQPEPGVGVADGVVGDRSDHRRPGVVPPVLTMIAVPLPGVPLAEP